MKHNKYSLINWFIRQAMEDKELTVYGNGNQIRDYVFVEDVSDIFIKAALNPNAYGNVFNLGSGEPTRFKDMVQTIVDVVGSGRIKFIPWPENYINVETGDFVADISKMKNIIKTYPKTLLKDGVKQTFSFYKNFKHYYWD